MTDRYCSWLVFLFLLAFVVTSLLRAPIPSAAQASTRAPQRGVLHGPVFALGDSVMLGAGPDLQRYGITVNAVESRQFFEGVSILQWMHASGRLPSIVVVDLGTNGPISNALFDSMMAPLRAVHRVYFLTVKEPRWWEGAVNSVIRAGVARWPHARLVDWYSASSLHPEWFWADGIHLRPEGAMAYTQLILAALDTFEGPQTHRGEARI